MQTGKAKNGMKNLLENTLKIMTLTLAATFCQSVEGAGPDVKKAPAYSSDDQTLEQAVKKLNISKFGLTEILKDKANSSIDEKIRELYGIGLSEKEKARFVEIFNKRIDEKQINRLILRTMKELCKRHKWTEKEFIEIIDKDDRLPNTSREEIKAITISMTLSDEQFLALMRESWNEFITWFGARHPELEGIIVTSPASDTKAEYLRILATDFRRELVIFTSSEVVSLLKDQYGISMNAIQMNKARIIYINTWKKIFTKEFSEEIVGSVLLKLKLSDSDLKALALDEYKFTPEQMKTIEDHYEKAVSERAAAADSVKIIDEAAVEIGKLLNTK